MVECVMQIAHAGKAKGASAGRKHHTTAAGLLCLLACLFACLPACLCCDRQEVAVGMCRATSLVHTRCCAGLPALCRPASGHRHRGQPAAGHQGAAGSQHAGGLL